MTTLSRVSGGRLFIPELVSFSAEPGCGFIAFLADADLGASLPSSISLAQGLGRGRFLLCDGGFWTPPTWRLLQMAVDDSESSSAFSSNVLIVLALDATGRPSIKDGILGDVAAATVRTDTVSIEDWRISIVVGAGRMCVLEASADNELRIRGAQSITLAGGSGSVGGTVLGALIFGVIISGFTFLKLDAYYQEMVKGVIIVSAVVLDQWRQRSRTRG